jgi:hypothetical protein
MPLVTLVPAVTAEQQHEIRTWKIDRVITRHRW